jgi:aspartate ammonia-lyase
VIAYDLLQSIDLLGNAAARLRREMRARITANRARAAWVRGNARRRW